MVRATAGRIPIVARGAGTGLAAGSSAQAGEIVLDVSGMNRILRLDPLEQIIVVERASQRGSQCRRRRARAVLRTRSCQHRHLLDRWEHRDQRRRHAVRQVRVTRESVLALKVVLPDGRILVTGRETIKGVTGYDLNALMIGSEGTLGIVVEATLRLRPLPAATATVAAFFPDIVAAAQAASAIIASRVTPSVLELMDGPTLSAVDAALGTDYRSRGGAFLLAQTDGYGAFLEQEVLIQAIEPLASSYEKATDPEQTAELLKVRREAIPSLELLGDVCIGDVGVPRGHLAEMVAGIEEISRRTGVRIFTVAHAADGNLHR